MLYLKSNRCTFGNDCLSSVELQVRDCNHELQRNTEKIIDSSQAHKLVAEHWLAVDLNEGLIDYVMHQVEYPSVGLTQKDSSNQRKLRRSFPATATT